VLNVTLAPKAEDVTNPAHTSTIIIGISFNFIIPVKNTNKLIMRSIIKITFR